MDHPGGAGATLRAEFEDCEVSVVPGTTTLRAELPGPASAVAWAGITGRG